MKIFTKISKFNYYHASITLIAKKYIPVISQLRSNIPEVVDANRMSTH